MKRCALVLLAVALVALPLADAQTSKGATVAIAKVEHPPTIVAEKPFALTVSLESRSSADTHVRLVAAAYALADGHPCGAATDARFRGFVHKTVADVTLAAGARATFPAAGDLPWQMVANASQIGSDARLEICVFAEDASSPVGQGIRYFDYSNFTVASRLANDPPRAAFTFTPAHPNATEIVTFTATASDAEGDAIALAWDFGHFNASGRAKAVGAVARHFFYPAGTYVVTLTARDAWDSSSATKEIVVAPEPPQPTAPSSPSSERAWWQIPSVEAFAALVAATAAALAVRRRA